MRKCSMLEKVAWHIITWSVAWSVMDHVVWICARGIIFKNNNEETNNEETNNEETINKETNNEDTNNEETRLARLVFLRFCQVVDQQNFSERFYLSIFTLYWSHVTISMTTYEVKTLCPTIPNILPHCTDWTKPYIFC